MRQVSFRLVGRTKCSENCQNIYICNYFCPKMALNKNKTLGEVSMLPEAPTIMSCTAVAFILQCLYACWLVSFPCLAVLFEWYLFCYHWVHEYYYVAVEEQHWCQMQRKACTGWHGYSPQRLESTSAWCSRKILEKVASGMTFSLGLLY